MRRSVLDSRLVETPIQHLNIKGDRSHGGQESQSLLSWQRRWTTLSPSELQEEGANVQSSDDWSRYNRLQLQAATGF